MTFAAVSIAGAATSLLAGGIGILGGAKRTKQAKKQIASLEAKEPVYNIPDFYKQNIAKAQEAATQQTELANRMAGMGTDYAKQLQQQQAQFATEYRAGAEKAATGVENLGKMAMQRGLGPAGQMGADILAQQAAGAMKGATDRRMGGALAGSILRQQQQGMAGLVSQAYQAQTAGLGQYMQAKQYGAGLRQQALGMGYQTGVEAGRIGYGAQMSGMQAQQQAGLTGYQLGTQAGGMLAQQEVAKQQADWEKWANEMGQARADLAQGRQQTSSALGSIASAGGQAIGIGLPKLKK
jgi:hypothetical protein